MAIVRELDNRGFTLIELLMTVLILTLVSMMLVSVLPAAFSAYASTVDTSNADSMLSTVTMRLREELSVADPTTVVASSSQAASKPLSTNSDCILKFKSMDTGRWVYITNETDGIYVWQSIDEDESGVMPDNAYKSSLVPLKTGAGVGETLLIARFADSNTAVGYSAGVFTLGKIVVTQSNGNELITLEQGKMKVRTITVS